MKPINQTRYASLELPGYGNCFTACVASLLNLPLWAVPNFIDAGPDWFEVFWNFMRTQNVEYVGCYPYKGRMANKERFGGEEEIKKFLREYQGIDGYYITTGKSPREFVKNGHAVIYKAGKLAHDPHKDKTGITEIWDIFMIERIKKVNQ